MMNSLLSTLLWSYFFFFFLLFLTVQFHIVVVFGLKPWLWCFLPFLVQLISFIARHLCWEWCYATEFCHFLQCSIPFIYFAVVYWLKQAHGSNFLCQYYVDDFCLVIIWSRMLAWMGDHAGNIWMNKPWLCCLMMDVCMGEQSGAARMNRLLICGLIKQQKNGKSWSCDT